MSLKSSQKIDTNRYELEITIDAEKFAAACEKAYMKNKNSINVPGFRKGKAPRSLVEKMYGEGVFYEDAFNDLYPAEIDAAALEAGVEIVDFKNVDFDVKSLDKNGAEFTVKVTVKPEVELGEYKGLSAERPSTEVSDEEINAEIEKMRDRASRMVTIEDRAAADGDIVVFDFDGYVDGVAFEGGKAESYSLTLGSGQFIPGFEEQIVGHNTNDEFDVNVTFPEDYHAEELKGKAATFKCKLHEIKTRELPELDDEFVKDVSEFDTLDELKEDTKKKLAEKKEKDADVQIDTQLIEAVIGSMNAEIPQAMIETRIDDDIRDFDYSLQMQGVNLETYMKYMGMTAETVREQYKERAEKEVKIRLALEKIAEIENTVPSDEEIEEQYNEYAKNYQMEIEKIKKAIPQSEIVKDLSVKKASDLIKETAKITYAAKAE